MAATRRSSYVANMPAAGLDLLFVEFDEAHKRASALQGNGVTSTSHGFRLHPPTVHPVDQGGVKLFLGESA